MQGFIKRGRGGTHLLYLIVPPQTCNTKHNRFAPILYDLAPLCEFLDEGLTCTCIILINFCVCNYDYAHMYVNVLVLLNNKFLLSYM